MYSNQQTSENKPTTQIYSIMDPELIPIIKDSILKNNIEKLKEVINKNNVNNLMFMKEEGNITPLMLAASEGNIEAVNFLLGCGAKVDLVFKSSTYSRELAHTALACAALKGHAEVVKLLEENGASFQKEVVEYRSCRKKNTLLIEGLSIFTDSICTKKPSLKGIKYLLGRSEMKPVINVQNQDGETALFWAVVWGKEEIINLLELAHGASFKKEIVDHRSQPEKSTILIELFKDFDSKNYMKGIQYLLQRPEIKSIINEKNTLGETALLLAIMNGEGAIVKILENYGASFQEAVINFRYPENKNTTLIEEIKKNDDCNDAAIQDLLKHPEIKSIISVKNIYGETALLLAAMNGKEAIVKSLEDLGASFQKEVIEYRSSEDDTEKGNTALIRTIKGEKRGVEYLLSRPEITSIISVKNTLGETALLLAARNGKEKIVKSLEVLGASFQKEVIEYRSSGEDPDEDGEYSEEGNTVLIEAVNSSNRKGIRYLLSRSEIKAIINEKDLKGNAALFCKIFTVCRFGEKFVKFPEEDVKEIKLFLAAGADIEAIDIGFAEKKAGQNKIFECVKAAKELMQLAQGDKTIKRTLSELLSAGASVHQRDTKSNTPLHLAVNSTKESLIVELLQEGADVKAINDSNLTPLQCAEKLFAISKENSKASIFSILYLHQMESQLYEAKGKTGLEIKNLINTNLKLIKDLDARAKIYLELGKKIKDEFYLSPFLTMEDGRDFLYSVAEGTFFHAEAQYEIANMHFMDQVEPVFELKEEEKENECIKQSVFHSLKSGKSEIATGFRKELIGIFLGEKFRGNKLDPLDPADMMLFLQNYKNLERKNAELEKRLKVEAESKGGKTEVLFDFSNNNNHNNNNNSNRRRFSDEEPEESPDKKKRRISNE